MKPAVLLLVVLATVPVSAAGAPVGGAEWVDGPLARGLWWGEPAAEAAARLGGGPSSPGLGDAWHLERALAELWSVRPSTAFSRVEVATASWVYAHGERLLGQLTRVPVGDWDIYERAILRRSGPPRKLHFPVDPPRGAGGERRHVHVYLWDDGATQFLFIKPTREDTEAYWREQETGTVFRVRLMQKLEDPDVPLYVGAFDSRLLKALRRRRGPPSAAPPRPHRPHHLNP